MKEVKIMCSLSHPCTVRLYAWVQTPLAMIMEMAVCDLRQYYQGKKEGVCCCFEGSKERVPRASKPHRFPSTFSTDNLGPYSLHAALKVCLDAAKGVGYLHSTDLIHRDLKSMNIMIGDDMRGKIADYGESREKATDMTMTSTGTPLWMAPEVSLCEHYDSKADVYSFGIVLYEVCKRDLPYRGRKDVNAIGLAVEVALDGLRPTIEEEWHEGIKSLLRDCYKKEASARPTCAQAEARLKLVIEDLGKNGGGAKGKVAGTADAEQVAKRIDSNLIGLDLWRAIKTDWCKLTKHERIGGVSR